MTDQEITSAMKEGYLQLGRDIANEKPSSVLKIDKHQIAWFSINGDDLSYYGRQSFWQNQRDVEDIIEPLKEVLTETESKLVVLGYLDAIYTALQNQELDELINEASGEVEN